MISKVMVPLQYAPNGVQVNFPYDFKIFAPGDLEVYLLNAVNQQSLAVLDQDYTVTGVGNESGGAVVFTTAPATSLTLTIRRVLPLVQTNDYVENDAFPAVVHENALDKIVMITQQLQEQASRSLRIPPSFMLSGLLPAPLANTALCWDALAESIINRTIETMSIPEIDSIGNYGDFLEQAVRDIGAGVRTLWVNKAITLSTNLTVPNNIQIVVTREGRIIIDNCNLTINGHLDAGLYQIFSCIGTGAVAGNPKVTAIYPEWFGAKGDNTTDDAAAINAAAVLARTADCRKIVLSSKTGYKTASQVDLRQLHVSNGDGGKASIYSTYNGGASVLAGNSYNLNINLQVERPAKDWTSGTIGIKISNAHDSNFHLSAKFHETGIKFEEGNGQGSHNNDVFLGSIFENKWGLILESVAGTSGWCNGNRYFGGDFNATVADGSTTAEFCIKLLGGGQVIDQNLFFAPQFQYIGASSFIASVIIDGGQNNRFLSCRQESYHNKIAQFLSTNNLFQSVNNTITLESVDFSKGLIDWDVQLGGNDTYGNNVSMESESVPQRLNDISSFDAAYDDGSQVHVPGFLLFDNSGVVSRTVASAYYSLFERGGRPAILSAGNYTTGIRVKFTDNISQIKKLYVRKRGSASGTYLRIICFDSSGAILSGTGPYYVKGRKVQSSGSFYNITADPFKNSLIFNTAVASVLIGVNTTSTGTGYHTGLEVFSPYGADAYLDYAGPLEIPGNLFAAQAPTKWHFRQGESIKNTGATTGAAPGWVNIKRVDTTLTANASGTDLTITVASIAGLASGDLIGVKLDSGLYHFTTINGAPGGSTVTLTAAIPGSGVVATSGNAVVANLWKAMPNL